MAGSPGASFASAEQQTAMQQNTDSQGMGRGTNRISCNDNHITNDDLKTEELFPMTGEPFPVRILFPVSRLIPYFSPHAKFDIYRNFY